MLSDIFIYIVLTLISFFPVVIWAYIFSIIDDNPINRKRFVVWLIWWALSVVPILYLDRILNIFNFQFLNIFYYISKIWWLVSSLEFWVSLSVFLLFVVIFSLIFWSLSNNIFSILKIYIKNLLVFLWFIWILSLLVYVSNFLLSFVDIPVWDWIMFWEIVFNTLKLIIFYYLLVAFIEEASKHFNFLHSSVLHINTVKQWVLYAIFVALGFSMIENILYLYSFYKEFWLTWWLVGMYFMRSLVSIVVHVLCSSVIAYYFSRALLMYRDKDLSFPYLKVFFYWLFISILLHLVFDVALTLWFTIVLFLYFIWGYLYVSSIFYRD